MIQEPQAQTQTTQFRRQIQQQPQNNHHRNQLNTAADTVTVTELGTLTPNLTIPIAINSQLHQRIVLITTPKNRTQSQPQPQQVPSKRFIRVPFLPRSENRVPFLTRSENRVPFLQRSEPITLLVKKNSLPKSSLVASQRPTTAVYLGQSTQIPQTQTVKNTGYNYSNSSVAQATPTTPLTLATMAGIQLTGADESFADMSGAMPTTATVEEINVPVFIDEYLQQSAPTSTTTAATATNINNNHNNSSNNGYGNDNCIEDEDDGTFENFEFDIGMIEEEEEEQMYLCNINNNNNSNNMSNNSNDNENCFNNNNNNHTCNNTLKNDIKNEDEDFKLEQQFLIAPNTNNSDDFFSEEITFGNDYFHQNDLNAFPTEEAIDISHFTNEEFSFSDFMTSSQHNPMLCETISISSNNSQQLLTNAEPLLPDCDQEYEQFEINTKLSQQRSQPMMMPPQYAVAAVGGGGAGELFDMVKMEMDMDMANGGSSGGDGSVSNNNNNNNNNSSGGATIGSLKRVSGGEYHTTPTMAEKRRKLHLNTSLRYIATQPELKTPDVINLITEMSSDEHKMSSTKTEIINELLNGSNSSFHSVTTEIYASLVGNEDGATTNHTASSSVVDGELNTTTSCYDDDCDFDEDDYLSPCTPHSCASSSLHTTHTSSHTSPNSPALSIASTSANSASNSRKKRGRPSKKHSDRPDPKQMRNLSESECKRLEDRAKNNEASRLSRLKNRKREEEEMEEEKHLNTANAALRDEMIDLDSTIEKLKRALKRMQFRAS